MLPKLIPQPPGASLPLKPSISLASKPRLPPSSPNKPRSLGKPLSHPLSKPPEKREAMVSRVSEADRARVMSDKEKAQSVSVWRQKAADLSEKVGIVLGRKVKTAEEIDADLFWQRVDKRWLFRAKTHKEIDNKLDKLTTLNMEITNAIASITRDIISDLETLVERNKEVYWELYSETRTTPLEKRALEIETAIEEIRIDFYFIKNGSFGRPERLAINRGATAIEKEVHEYKVVQWKGKSELWIKLDRNRWDVNRAVLNFLGEKNDLFGPSSFATRILVPQFLSAVRRVVRFDTRNALENWSHSLSFIAHQIRDLELSHRTGKHLPEITFGRRWAKSLEAFYVWPLESNIKELSVETQHSAFDEDFLRANGYSLQYMGRLRDIRSAIVTSMKRMEKTLDLYRRIVANEFSVYCPHPFPKLHLAQRQAFHPIQKFHETWEVLVRQLKDTRGAMQVTDKHFQEGIDPDVSRARNALYQVFKEFSERQSDADHPLSSRGNHHARNMVFIWHSAHILCEGIESPDKSYRNEFKSVSLRMAGRQTPKALAGLVATRSLKAPKDWLNNNDLYPISEPVIIDYITSAPTLQQVVKELGYQQVIGLDVCVSTKIPSEDFKLLYILISSETNVYILDVQAIKEQNPKYFIECMESIFENSSVLKVCMNSKWIEDQLWSDLAVGLSGVYDLQPHLLPEETNDSTGMTSMLRRYLDLDPPNFKNLDPQFRFLKSLSPKNVFHSLGMKAYIPFKLFHILNKIDIVETSDKQHIDLTKHYNRLLRHDFSGSELGPVSIDNMKGGRRGSVFIPRAISRGEWLRRLALRMAQECLQNHRKRFRKPIPVKLGSQGNDTDVAVSLTAYYLATTFGQTLRKIEMYLKVDNAANLVLQAADTYSLRLNNGDRVKFEAASQVKVAPGGLAGNTSPSKPSRVRSPERRKAVSRSRNHQSERQHRSKGEKVHVSPTSTLPQAKSKAISWKPFVSSKSGKAEQEVTTHRTGVTNRLQTSLKRHGSMLPSSQNKIAVGEKFKPARARRRLRSP